MSHAKSLSRLLALAVLVGSGCYAGPVFSLKTNSDFPTLGTDFAFTAGRIQPFLGVSNYAYRAKDRVVYTPDPGGSSNTNSFAATVFITSLGLRVHLRQEGVKPYLFGNLYKFFTIIDSDGNSMEEDDEIEQLLSPFGFGVGFGGEYPISEKFAVFGEYGYRAIFPSVESTETDPFDNSQRTADLSIMFSTLNGAAGMRFYF